MVFQWPRKMWEVGWRWREMSGTLIFEGTRRGEGEEEPEAGGGTLEA